MIRSPFPGWSEVGWGRHLPGAQTGRRGGAGPAGGLLGGKDPTGRFTTTRFTKDTKKEVRWSVPASCSSASILRFHSEHLLRLRPEASPGSLLRCVLIHPACGRLLPWSGPVLLRIPAPPTPWLETILEHSGAERAADRVVSRRLSRTPAPSAISSPGPVCPRCRTVAPAAPGPRRGGACLRSESSQHAASSPRTGTDQIARSGLLPCRVITEPHRRHSRISPLASPVARTDPLGENARAWTGPVCPTSVQRSRSVTGSQS